jgi:CheY-like chemotaxis protein
MATILIVDDEPDIRFLIRLIFETAGHKVTEARHGAADLKSVKAEPPDLVVTDVMMPTMDGLEFIERLRANPGTAAIPILVVSGNSGLATAADIRLRVRICDRRAWPHRQGPVGGGHRSSGVERPSHPG